MDWNPRDIIGTVWRDSNWHVLTITGISVPLGEDPNADITLHGTTSNCTPWVCPWSHEGKTSEIPASLLDVVNGRIFGWTRQDLWEADPHRPAEPQVTEEQRRLGLETWERIEAMPSPNPDDAARERRR